MHARYLLPLLFPLAALSANVRAGQGGGYGPGYLQGMLGSLDAGEAWTLEDPSTGETLSSDLGRLIFGGVSAQQMMRDGRWQYGFEGGGLVSWKNANQTFFATGNTLAVSFDNALFLLQLSMGGSVSWRPVAPLRLSLGAGPELGLGTVYIDGDSAEYAGQEAALIQGGRYWGAGAGFYGRAGLEFIVNKVSFGLAVRRSSTQLDMGGAGEIDLSDPQWLLTVGALL